MYFPKIMSPLDETNHFKSLLSYQIPQAPKKKMKTGSPNRSQLLITIQFQ